MSITGSIEMERDSTNKFANLGRKLSSRIARAKSDSSSSHVDPVSGRRESKGLLPGLASTPDPSGCTTQYQSTISGHTIIESTAPGKDIIQNTYATHASITTEVRLRETACDTITTALDSSSGISFISDFEAHCNFAPAERKHAATLVVIPSAGGYISLSQYVVADIFFPCILNGQKAIAKTAAVLFVRKDRMEHGAGILLGTDFMEAQSFSIQYSARCAIIGSCVNASIPLSFLKNES